MGSSHWLMPQSPGSQISLGNTSLVSCPVIDFMGNDWEILWEIFVSKFHA